MRRREFLKTTVSGTLAIGLGIPRVDLIGQEPVAHPRSMKWYKGNIHSHSQWSDGWDLPEVVVDSYKKRGYDFFSLTDHNILHQEELRFTGFAMNYTPSDVKPFSGETSFWKRVSTNPGWPNLIDAHVKRAQEIFGEDSVKIIETGDGKYVRMKTEKELQAQFAEPDRFLLIPGFEMTSQNVHVNLINVGETFFMEDSNIKNLVVETYDKSCELYDVSGSPYLYTVNHPLWQYYNIQPSYFFPRPGIRFVEIGNNNTSWAYIPEAWTPEQLWDIVNAYRAKRDEPSLLGTGTDDSHGVFRDDYRPFHSWTRVLSDRLETNAILTNLLAGRSYISTGLEFSHIAFDGKTLEVKLAPQVEGEYRIEFIGTKQDYDETSKLIQTDGKDGRPTRTIECWSQEIGRVFAQIDGLEGSYTLKADDLYVRAKAYRLGAGTVDHGKAYKISPLSADGAWSQPYRPGEKL